MISSSCHCTFAILPHEGDIIVDGNKTLTIENCEYHFTGNITIEDNATLIIRNAIFNQTGLGDPVGIVVKNRANLIITNTTLIISQAQLQFPSKILVQDEAKLNIVNSNITSSNQEIFIWPESSSRIYIENSVISGPKSCVVVTNGDSEVHIKNSRIDRVTAWVNSKVTIESSSLNEAIRAFNNCTINVFYSTIGYVTAYGSLTLYTRCSIIKSYVQAAMESHVWLVKTSVQKVIAAENSEVWLIDASVGAFEEHDNAKVYVGWETPFGPLAFHHTIAYIIQLVTPIAVGATLCVILFVAIMKLRNRQKKAKREGLIKNKKRSKIISP